MTETRETIYHQPDGSPNRAAWNVSETMDGGEMARELARLSHELERARGPAPQALADVLSERIRQDAKWGVQNHPPAVWMLILGEEAGEAAYEVGAVVDGADEEIGAVRDLISSGQECRRVLEKQPHPSIFPALSDFRRARYRKEMVQVAAVALAAIECLDRQEKEPTP